MTFKNIYIHPYQEHQCVSKDTEDMWNRNREKWVSLKAENHIDDDDDDDLIELQISEDRVQTLGKKTTTLETINTRKTKFPE